MKSVTYNDVTYYNLTEGGSLPEWLSQKKKGDLAKEQKRRRVELLQDLEFKGGAPQCIQLTDDRNYMWVSGEYPSQVRCYDLNEVSMKFSRHVESQIVGIQPVSEDYKKVIFLERNRWVEFHNQGGRHARIRTPKEGRAIAYDKRTSTAIIPTSCSSVYYFDLDAGSFSEPVVTQAEANDCVAICPTHPMFAVGGTNGKVECVDLRAPGKAVAVLDAISGLGGGGDDISSDSSDAHLFNAPQNAVTSLCFDNTGMSMLVGSSEGVVGVYDIRKFNPVYVKDHNNSLPIRQMQFHYCFDQRYAVTADTKGVKIWDITTGDNFIALDTSAELFGFVIPKSSPDRDGGVILAACDTSHVNTFYVPRLGPAPGWCSYIESFTEELEQTDVATGQYEDFKFVTREELERLQLTHLLKSDNDQIRPYMHGFYIDLNLYRMTKAILDPEEWGRIKKERILAKKEAEAEGRIEVVKRKKRDNLLKPVAEQDPRFAGKLGGGGEEGGKFAVDKTSSEYLKYHPAEREKNSAFRAVEDEEEDDGSDGGSSGLSDAEPSLPRRKAKSDEGGAGAAGKREARNVQMFELKEGRNILESSREEHKGRKREKHEKLTMGERLKRQQQEKERASTSKVHTVEGGTAKQITFSLDTEMRKRKRSNSAADDIAADDAGDAGKKGGKKGARRSFGKGKGGGGKGKGGKGGKRGK